MLQNKEKGFLMFNRELPPNAPVSERIQSFEEFAGKFSPEKTQQQALRCMNCGVPFCHEGCPLGNCPPDFNDAVKEGQWQKALDMLHATNNFPEFTGRVCPALCEASCVLGINCPAVAIEFIEKSIAEKGWQEGWIRPQPPKERTGKKIAVVGSGPAGLAAAQQLNRAGHQVTLFERSDEPGGLLMYGIPNFKLSKSVVKRRLDQMRAEGVEFRCGVEVGRDVSAPDLCTEYDAILLTTGSTKARKLDIPGHDLAGIHPAMDFLTQQTRRLLGKEVDDDPISAEGKKVLVLGGGDTGSDCVGTSIRQGAESVFSIELLPRPPLGRDDTMLWPSWPMILRTSTSHEEGGQREWSILTKEFLGEDGRVTAVRAVRLQWSEPDQNGRRTFEEIPDSEFTMDCDLVLLALGFLHPEHETVVEELGLELDSRGNIQADERFQTSVDKVFAAGDARRGQSLVVWAITEGREAAYRVDEALMGHSDLPRVDSFGYDHVETV